MSQLDRIKALLTDADDYTLSQTEDFIREQRAGQGTSGEGPTPDSASVDSNETDRQHYEQVREQADAHQVRPEQASEESLEAVDLNGGDGSPDGTIPTTALTDTERPPESNPADKLIHNDPS
jgi:hypothetical protein